MASGARRSRGNRVVFWDDIWPIVTSTFQAAGFATTSRPDLINHGGNTRFVGAGLQIFEPALYAGVKVPRGRLFVPQPAVRLNYLDAVARSDGFSTAFLNVCTEQPFAAIGDYLSHVDSWLDCLAALELPPEQTTLVLPATPWSGGPFRGSAVVALVSGVEVGDLVLIDDGDPPVHPLLPIVDTSFGLERLVSTCNRDMSYTSLLGPMPLSAVPELRVPLDRIRTATLLLMAGLTPAGRGRGRVLRSLATVDVATGLPFDVDAVVAHAHAYWSAFHSATVELERCQAIIRSERQRHTNRILLAVAGWRHGRPGLVTAPTDELCRHLLRSGATATRLTAAVEPIRQPAPGRRLTVDPRSTLTIVTPTSPIPGHPSPAMIHQAVRSLVRHGGLVGCRQLIVCDGHPHPADPSAVAYADYKRRIRILAEDGGFQTDVEIVELDQCVGLGGVMSTAVDRVRTPYLLTYEHDWRLIRPVDPAVVLGLFTAWPDVHYVRLNKRRTHEAGWDSVLKPDVRERDLPLVRTGCWSANPHFARTSHYRRVVLPHVQAQPQGGSDGFEHPVFYAYQADIHRLGFDRAQRRWGVYILGRLGDPAWVSHLDGRKTVPIKRDRRMTPGGASST